jgi:hypothetical protein
MALVEDDDVIQATDTLSDVHVIDGSGRSRTAHHARWASQRP